MTSQVGTTRKMVPRLIELIKPNPKSPVNRNHKPMLMEHFGQKHKLLSIPTTASKNVAHLGGERSYVLLGSLAKLERALMRWTTDELVRRHKFTPVVVPNIMHDHIIERCGFPTKSIRSQVYKIAGTNEESILDGNSTKSDDGKGRPCIAGTSEFALASIHIGDSIPYDELPKKYCAISRCYRAETSSTANEWGIYRVHYFNKVEMFAFTMPGDKSHEMHEEFLTIQKDLFNQLELHYQVLDMPEEDLGLSAKRKFDIEAWMEGRQRFGEISSTSNCEDYQSSRLNIRYSRMVECDNQLQIENEFVHTVNGTACSSIRTIIALCEQHQTEDGRVELPDVLTPYMNGIKSIPTDEDVTMLRDVDVYPEPVHSK